MKKNILIPIIVLLIFMIIVIILIMNMNKETNNEQQLITEQNEQKVVKKVESASAYFTVQSCINKYISYVSSKNTDSILKTIDSEYIIKNNITEENVLEKVEQISVGTIFEANKMYEEEIDSDNKIYYVLGTLKQDGLENYTIIDNNFCITVNMDFANNIFSIIPFGNGGLFDEKSD